MFAAAKHEIREIYTRRAGKKYGLEDISQLEHALQTAHRAERQGEAPAMILAALLHDVGHMAHELGENPAAHGVDDRHEIVGADWLAARLPWSISEPVRLHVQAKRYLCGTDPAYAAQLAPDSVVSLRLQGGPMTREECDAFIKHPFAADAVRLRRLDDEAKLVDCATPPLDYFLRLLDRITTGRVGAAERETFASQGYVVLRDHFAPAEQLLLNQTSSRFGAKAAAIIRAAAARGTSLSDHARSAAADLIVVAETADPTQVCRFEYLIGSDPAFARFACERIEPVVSTLAGEPFIAFKDKENEKHSGGGAFGPHQDFAAYQAFGPRYNITAMVSIDRQTVQNGCLEFATNLSRAARDGAAEKWIDERPLLPFYVDGARNGDIHDEMVARLKWQLVETSPADLVVFDSFVPHRSAANMTASSRRAMFLTYAPAREGDWYARYYADKRANYDDPKFHVSTPTART